MSGYFVRVCWYYGTSSPLKLERERFRDEVQNVRSTRNISHNNKRLEKIPNPYVGWLAVRYRLSFKSVSKTLIRLLENHRFELKLNKQPFMIIAYINT